MNNRQRANFFAVLILLVLCISVASIYPNSLKLLMWERDAINAGQWWRLLTAHLVHLDARHLLLNLFGLLLIVEILCQTMTALDLTSLLLISFEHACRGDCACVWRCIRLAVGVLLVAE